MSNRFRLIAHPPPYHQVLVHGVIQTLDKVSIGGGEISSVWEFNLVVRGYIIVCVKDIPDKLFVYPP